MSPIVGTCGDITGQCVSFVAPLTICIGPLCNDARGGVFNRNASTSWSPMGLWQLGLKSIGIHANGDYGMETIVVFDSVRRWQTSFHKLLVAGINDTSAYTGFFGLGITEGKFDGVVAQGPIAALVEQSGTIPSHSYGYTAGAYYGKDASKLPLFEPRKTNKQ